MTGRYFFQVAVYCSIGFGKGIIILVIRGLLLRFRIKNQDIKNQEAGVKNEELRARARSRESRQEETTKFDISLSNVYYNINSFFTGSKLLPILKILGS